MKFVNNVSNSRFIKSIIYKTALCIFLLFLFSGIKAQAVIDVNNNHQEILLSGNYSSYIDTTFGKVTEANILQQSFDSTGNQLPLYKIGTGNVWLMFRVINQTKSPLYLDLRYSNLSKVTLYKTNNHSLERLDMQGNTLPRTSGLTSGPNFIFSLLQIEGTQQEYILHIESIHPVIVPAYVCTTNKLQSSNLAQFIIAALFTGVLLVMILYNSFLFFAVQDNNYIVYVFYTFSLLLAQLTADGYLAKYIWPNLTSINQYAVIFTTNLPIISGMVFAVTFLQIQRYAPHIRWLFFVIIGIAVADILLSFFHLFALSYIILNYNSILTGLVIFCTSIYIARKGYRSAYLYLVGWISMLIAIIILALRNISILPYNNFTSHIIYIGAALEATMLSFALADRINTYKKEKELSQAEALNMARENEKLIQEQNLVLEKQVEERTYDLQKTLRELKDAQIQLVEAEKMASLGQLTAGIAHEINNPINFVKSNVSPLHLDVQDLFELISEYQKLHDTSVDTQPGMLKKIRDLENRLDPDFLKEEIESLIGGIEEGAERTAEIVRGLRSFSRLDESESKEVNVYENINSTLVLLRNNIPHYLKVRKHFEARAEIECYPGKLNQVFMNILTNSIHAIKAKPLKSAEEYIDISTREINNCMQIKIADTGIGMTEEVKHKIFEPFFTTKDVGEGTGLGMAIVFKIIEKHNGKISVQSSPGEGAAFTIEIPYVLRSETAITEREITETEEADL